MKRIDGRIRSPYHNTRKLFQSMTIRGEKTDELSLRSQLAGAC